MTQTSFDAPPGATAAAPAPISESRLLLLLGAVQFINVVDFVMVLPLGPDFARALGIPAHQLGLVAGSYTAAAAIAGLLASSFLDRFDRRRALGVAMLGLVTGTLAGGFATGLGSMLFARVLAGTFGGPATSLALSILTDAVPPERRGRAMGKVMGAFSVAAVVGVPAGLELARLGGWQVPFFVIAALGVMVALGVAAMMPPMRGHLSAAQALGAPQRPFAEFARDSAVLLALTGTAVAMTGSFSIISNLSAYVQFNLGYPREQLGLLYMVGGSVSFFSMRLAGRSVDRWGAPSVVSAGTALVVAVIGLGFLGESSLLPVLCIFVGFMLGNSTRTVALNALTTRVPPASDRARFMSLQSAVQHVSTSAGAGLSSWVLRERADQRLEGMPSLAAFAIGMSSLLPIVVLALSRRVRARDAARNVRRSATNDGVCKVAACARADRSRFFQRPPPGSRAVLFLGGHFSHGCSAERSIFSAARLARSSTHPPGCIHGAELMRHCPRAARSLRAPARPACCSGDECARRDARGVAGAGERL